MTVYAREARPCEAVEWDGTPETMETLRTPLNELGWGIVGIHPHTANLVLTRKTDSDWEDHTVPVGDYIVLQSNHLPTFTTKEEFEREGYKPAAVFEDTTKPLGQRLKTR